MDALINKEKERLALLKSYGYDVSGARDFILKKARLDRGRVLEIGTGKGHLTLALAKQGAHVISIDLDGSAQKTMRAYLKRENLRKSVSLKIMDAEKLKFPRGSFDSIISANFMHHAKNPLRCLREMVRMARTMIIIADINRKGEYILGRKSAGCESLPDFLSVIYS